MEGMIPISRQKEALWKQTVPKKIAKGERGNFEAMWKPWLKNNGNFPLSQ
jgi:hypothetical protein